MIPIEIDPNLIVSGSLIISWHGFFSLLAVITALILVARWAPTKNIDPDDIYSIGAWGIIGGNNWCKNCSCYRPMVIL